ncbi:hypothetical protein IFM58399_10100 [Aspergillus lentulus]|uniref:Uncharacterized protein n=1 Tax=Aspergillus lentulus TaxID=293939 RepID=A0ABQ0ZSW4_ASPLE|nr:uncharacterized protein IFM58399_10100 [Aspergillus lentulus]GFF55547.1 hypothetical protein IFM58399_10100 [Aspergillus lentulus]GFF63338.1 hypothetical protein IFM60648_00898 [Aspergillus lentulus]GFF66969.1 hypothetical protein IFM62136_06799 [Aspergillus lentulus]GFF92247.1 hypothetical protein IFM47457_09120 [Aspergillus lentulus]
MLRNLIRTTQTTTLRPRVYIYTPILTRSIQTHPQPSPDELDRQTLHPERAENTQSGTDDEVARHTSSYDPSTTTPEIESQALEDECKLLGEVDPLFFSPAHREVSALLDPKLEVAVHTIEHLSPSAKGWTRKHKEVIIRKVPGAGSFDQFERLLKGLRDIQKRGGSGGSGSAVTT